MSARHPGLLGPDAAVPGSAASGDSGGVRAAMAPSTALEGDPTLVVARGAGPPPATAGELARDAGGGEGVAVDGVTIAARLRRLDARRFVLEVPVGWDPGAAGAADEPAGEADEPAGAADDAGGERAGAAGDASDPDEATAGAGAGAAGAAAGPSRTKRTRVLIGPLRRGPGGRTDVREIVVDGWRFEVTVEPEQRARLRERARRGDAAGAAGGPVEVRAIIPGRVVAVSVQPGDAVVAGQQILVVEAMKMQNELRAPREGSVDRVGVAVGDTIEIGDLLVVIH